MRHSLLLFLAIIGIACAGGNRAGSVTVAAATDDLQTQSPTTTVQSFTAVQGADLMARAHERCPYSNATRGNIDVELSVDGVPLAAAAKAPCQAAAAGEPLPGSAL